VCVAGDGAAPTVLFMNSLNDLIAGLPLPFPVTDSLTEHVAWVERAGGNADVLTAPVVSLADVHNVFHTAHCTRIVWPASNVSWDPLHPPVEKLCRCVGRYRPFAGPDRAGYVTVDRWYQQLVELLDDVRRKQDSGIQPAEASSDVLVRFASDLTVMFPAVAAAARAVLDEQEPVLFERIVGRRHRSVYASMPEPVERLSFMSLWNFNFPERDWLLDGTVTVDDLVADRFDRGVFHNIWNASWVSDTDRAAVLAQWDCTADCRQYRTDSDHAASHVRAAFAQDLHAWVREVRDMYRDVAGKWMLLNINSLVWPGCSLDACAGDDMTLYLRVVLGDDLDGGVVAVPAAVGVAFLRDCRNHKVTPAALEPLHLMVERRPDDGTLKVLHELCSQGAELLDAYQCLMSLAV
jgi:hypothetical protein